MRGVTVSKVHPRRSRWGILRRGGPLDPPHGTWITFATEEEAQRERAKALRELARAQGGAQISAAVEEYLALLGRRGRKASSIAACRGMLAAFWPEQSELIASVGPDDYEALVKRDSPRGKPYSAAFHQQALIRARAVCALAVKRGWLKSNPLVDVEAQGRINRGKFQLSEDEAVKWTAAAIERARGGDETAVAALCCYLLGLRVSEACTPAVRDLDAGGTVLKVMGKGDRVRRLRLWSHDPRHEADLAELRDLLARVAAGKLPLAPLLTTSRGKVWRRVREVCRAAEVPEVCPHSLRGLHLTLRVQGGEDVRQVAAHAGNSPRVLESSYLQPGAVESGRIARVVPIGVRDAQDSLTRLRKARQVRGYGRSSVVRKLSTDEK